MYICWPKGLIQGIIFRSITQRRYIIGERIYPYINNMLRVIFDRNAPIERRSRDCQILKTWLDKIVNHFITSRFRLNKPWISFVVGKQSFRVLAHFEEIAFFFDKLYGMPTIRTFATHNLPLLIPLNVR